MPRKRITMDDLSKYAQEGYQKFRKALWLAQTIYFLSIRYQKNNGFAM